MTRVHWSCLIVLTSLVAGTPLRSAHAGLTLAGSVGMGGEVSPNNGLQATNLMIAPGYELSILRIELGLVGSLEAARAGHPTRGGFEFRPMLVLTPPLFPLYLRAVFATVDTFSSDFAIAYGGALGLRLSLVGISLFAEAGVLPRSIHDVVSWVIEGRLGVTYAF